MASVQQQLAARMFAGANPQAQFGINGGGTPKDDPQRGAKALAKSGGKGMLDGPGSPLWSPDNPLFWFGAILAVTFGAAAVNASVRIGPATIAGKLGK